VALGPRCGLRTISIYAALRYGGFRPRGRTTHDDAWFPTSRLLAALSGPIQRQNPVKKPEKRGRKRRTLADLEAAEARLLATEHDMQQAWEYQAAS
jgi:hypothetical protein